VSILDESGNRFGFLSTRKISQEGFDKAGVS
jgi:hypothetical protein